MDGREEKHIGRCLECLAPYGFEVIVADTGSDDRTMEIIRKYQAKLYQFAWCDDFAAAKNFAVSKASHPYVMVLDADEYLEKMDQNGLETLIRRHPKEVGRIRRRNVFTRNGLGQENIEWINRIFAKEDFGYEGRIHEQVVARAGGEYETYQAPVVILHSGYDLTDEERKKKTQRNIALLERELEERRRRVKAGTGHDAPAYAGEPCRAGTDGGAPAYAGEPCRAGTGHDAPAYAGEPCRAGTDGGAPTYAGEPGIPETELSGGVQAGADDGQIPYLLYQLGKSYYMAEDYLSACDYFSEGLSYDLNPKLEYVIDMVETYGYALLNSGQAEEALFFENIYNEFGHSADFLFLMGLIYMNNACFAEAIQEFQKAVRYRECRMQGVNSYAAYYNIGVICECLGDLEQAAVNYEKSGDYAPAKTRLQGLREKP